MNQPIVFMDSSDRLRYFTPGLSTPFYVQGRFTLQNFDSTPASTIDKFSELMNNVSDQFFNDLQLMRSDLFRNTSGHKEIFLSPDFEFLDLIGKYSYDEILLSWIRSDNVKDMLLWADSGLRVVFSADSNCLNLLYSLILHSDQETAFTIYRKLMEDLSSNEEIVEFADLCCYVDFNVSFENPEERKNILKDLSELPSDSLKTLFSALAGVSFETRENSFRDSDEEQDSQYILLSREIISTIFSCPPKLGFWYVSQIPSNGIIDQFSEICFSKETQKIVQEKIDESKVIQRLNYSEYFALLRTIEVNVAMADLSLETILSIFAEKLAPKIVFEDDGDGVDDTPF